MPTFEKWWNDLKKHRKRVEFWLPHWRAIAKGNGGRRPIRYFTLCANSMIDVFMLLREGLLTLDPISEAIESVRFCEYDVEQYNEIRDMISREGSGFFGRLEKIFLFKDNDDTAQYPTLNSIDLEFETFGESIPPERAEQLRIKRLNLEIRASFPYDCINLDFCQYYYPRPPGMLEINETVGRVLDWQRMPSADSEAIEVNQFLLTVTCRHDSGFPQEATNRLRELLRENCGTSETYRNFVYKVIGDDRVDEWPARDAEGFFLSGWPKDIARSAKERGWTTEILDYVYYERVGDEGNPYIIVCLVLKFSRVAQQPDYLPAALFALNQQNRKIISEVDRNSPEGQRLLTDLHEVVTIRNAQAVRKHRDPLPPP